MTKLAKARVFKNGRSQAVRIPLEFRFTTDEVYIRKDSQTGDLILSQSPQRVPTWQEIFAALDAALASGEIPDDFLAERNQGLPQTRDWS